jgi:hypothetical protein
MDLSSIISLIWGLLMAILFRMVCQNDKYVIVEVPNASVKKLKNNYLE